MYRHLLAPFAPLFKLEFSLDFFTVFSSVIVVTLTLRAVHFAEEFLCHTILKCTGNDTTSRLFWQYSGLLQGILPSVWLYCA